MSEPPPPPPDNVHLKLKITDFWIRLLHINCVGDRAPTPDYIAQALQWCEKHGFLKLLHNFAAYLNSDSTLNVVLISREIIMDYNTSLSSVETGFLPLKSSPRRWIRGFWRDLIWCLK